MSKVFYNWNKIETAVSDIGSQITRSDWRPDYIVGISRGGLIPAVLLSQYLNVPMKPLQVSLRDHIDTVSDCIMAEDAVALKNILIIDDINDTGETIAWIKQDWVSMTSSANWDKIWGHNVRFGTINNNVGSKESVDYYSTTVNKTENDLWVVYPWEEWWKVN